MISSPASIPFFIPFGESLDGYEIPATFSMMRDHTPHPLCLLAATELQHYLQTQQEWEHNFGLTQGNTANVIGKMFGVLVVETSAHEMGYLCAFSGKLAGANDHTRFVPPIFDGLSQGGFLNQGMQQLKTFSDKIQQLESEQPFGFEGMAKQLRTERKNHSIALQQQLFENYHCLNIKGEFKQLQSIFTASGYKNPPAGAAECATPKLLQYAFQHQLKPIAVAEFWWGQSPKSTNWKHGVFYPCCKEKCEPILKHMLSGLEFEVV
jgi:tRNA pseudouridine32 synthase/23S rRNA pseudouridine746 synthase